MIFIPDSVVEYEIDGATFKLRPLSGEEVLKILGKKGFDKNLDAEVAAELVHASVLEFYYEGKRYSKDLISALKTDVYLALLQKVMSLNMEVDTKNSPNLKKLS